ncbi:MAG: alpha-2-macroglobulin family protein, partial [Anaerolineae bacterium]
VVTGDSLLVATNLVPTPDSERGLRREITLLGPRGGVADTGSGTLVPEMPPIGRLDTAYFRADLITDVHGRVAFAVDLPHALSSWTLHAWAITPDTSIGEAVATFAISEPLSIKPISPAFLVAGDRAVLAAVVHNNTEELLVVDVTLAAGEPLVVESAPTQQVLVAPGRRQRVAWTVLAETTSGGSAEVTYSARSGAYLATSPPAEHGPDGGLLPIRGLVARDAATRAGALDNAGSHTETIMVNAADLDTEVVLRVDSTLASVVMTGLAQAISPETTDRLAATGSPDEWANVLVQIVRSEPRSEPRAEPGGLANAVTAVAAVDSGVVATAETLQTALEQLHVRQNSDGGWGWRQGASNLQLTSYVVHSLILAQQAGLAIPASITTDGLAYIGDWLASGIDSGLRPPYLAFALSVLAEADAAWPQGAGAALYADRDKMGVAGRAYLALAFGALDSSDTRLVSILSELRGMATMTGSSVHWEDHDSQSWVTSAQATAVALKVLTRFAPDDPLLPGIVRWLVASRGTQEEAALAYESAWVHSALADYVLISGDPGLALDWRVSLNGQTVAGSAASDPAGSANLTGRSLVFRVADLGPTMLREALNVIELIASKSESVGSGVLYYALQVNTSLPVSAGTRDERRGMALTREYCTVSASSDIAGQNRGAPSGTGQCQPVTALRVGEFVEVRLTAVVPRTSHYLRVEDPFPAGFEPDGTEPRANFGRPERRDDRMLFFAEQVAPGTYRASYRLRATIPGRFHALPATAEESYSPEVWARTTISVLEVLPH